MTEKVYQRDPYLQELTAKITRSEPRDGRWAVRLERTIFCPEGGGQPADAGTINDLPLLALENDGDEIVHVLDQGPGSGEARLQLDFARRYDHMQQHTAQHLLSQVLVRDFNAATLSFAIGPEHSSIEIGRPAFSEEEVRALEAECARLAFAALPVRVFEPTTCPPCTAQAAQGAGEGGPGSAWWRSRASTSRPAAAPMCRTAPSSAC